jgi:hypothetical protein
MSFPFIFITSNSFPSPTCACPAGHYPILFCRNSRQAGCLPRIALLFIVDPCFWLQNVHLSCLTYSGLYASNPVSQPCSTHFVIVCLCTYYTGCWDSLSIHGFYLLGFVITYTFILASCARKATCLRVRHGSARCPGPRMSNDDFGDD